MTRRFAALFVALWAGLGGAAYAQTDAAVHGRLEVQSALLIARPDSLARGAGGAAAGDLSGTLRLTFEPSAGHWSLSVHALAAFEDGAGERLERETAQRLPVPPPSLLDLERSLVDRGPLTASVSLDRLAVGYAGPDLVVRVGRQALTWGSGLVFRPMDLFDPFSPAATDTEYKPGTDMAYAQWLLPGGADLQAVVAPRGARAGQPPTWSESAFALKLHASLVGHGTDWLIARDHGDLVAGIGVNGALGGATWNLELVPSAPAGGGVNLSAVANLSDAVTAFGRNATIFAEYFRNGPGVAGGALNLASLPSPLVSRLSRGQVFTVRRDYVAVGSSLELTPLVTLGATLIVDADDASAFALATGTISLADNAALILGAEVPAGPARSEYGGAAVTVGNRVTAAPPASLYVQVRRYF